MPLALPERIAGLGVLGLGLAWSFGVFIAEQEQVAASGVGSVSAFGLVALGGVLTVAAVWFGVGAVTWAMGRLLRGRAGFFAVLLSLSAAAPPLWLGGPALAVLASGASHPLLYAVAAVAMAAFLVLVVAGMAALQAWSLRRACGSIAMTAMFCASFLSLYA